MGIKTENNENIWNFNELNLSYQKAHRDYANASQEQQKIFILSLKKFGI